MSENDEEVYETVFNALRHGVRRKILRMLSENSMPFMTMAGRLELSSSHLTYHLESLKELVAKENGSYKLSVFGKAAFQMMKNIEDPPNLVNPGYRSRNMRTYLALSIIGLMFVSGLYLTHINSYNLLNAEYELQTVELDTLNQQINALNNIVELSKSNPVIYGQNGVHLVSGWSLDYRYDSSDSGFFNLGNCYCIFYSPGENLTLELSPVKQYPVHDYVYPLSIQKGNAFQNVSSVYVETYYEEMNTSYGEWMSPVVWQRNVTSTRPIQVTLPSEGWYTISMTGPISLGNGDGFTLRLRLGDSEPNVWGDDVKLWINFRLLNGHAPVIFGVAEGYYAILE